MNSRGMKWAGEVPYGEQKFDSESSYVETTWKNYLLMGV
jgi:hypothetical protein